MLTLQRPHTYANTLAQQHADMALNPLCTDDVRSNWQHKLRLGQTAKPTTLLWQHKLRLGQTAKPTSLLWQHKLRLGQTAKPTTLLWQHKLRPNLPRCYGNTSYGQTYLVAMATQAAVRADGHTYLVDI
jgi:hypothetical protein